MAKRFITVLFWTLFCLSCKPQKGSLLFLNVSEFPAESIPVVFNSRDDLMSYLEEGKRADILFFNDAGALEALTETNTSLMPRSMKALGIMGNQRLALPLQSNTTGRGLFGRIFRALLSPGTGGRRRPGTTGYHAPASGNSGRSSIPYSPLPGYRIRQVSGSDPGRIRQWKGPAGITGDAGKMAGKGNSAPGMVPLFLLGQAGFYGEGLGGAMILRLSEHREMPLELISFYEAVPFPYEAPRGLAVDIYAPPLFGALLRPR